MIEDFTVTKTAMAEPLAVASALTPQCNPKPLKVLLRALARGRYAQPYGKLNQSHSDDVEC
jgi:hypothetical protein